MPIPFISSNRFYGILSLERLFPEHLRRLIARIFTIGIILSLLPLAYILLTKFATGLIASAPFLSQKNFVLPSLITPFWLGIFYILLAPRLFILALEGYAGARTAKTAGSSSHPTVSGRLNFYATMVWFKSASLFDKTTPRRILETLPRTTIGQSFLLRLGISTEDYIEFLAEQTTPTKETSTEALKGAIERNSGELKEVTFTDLVVGLLDIYKPLYGFFGERGITKEMFRETARWVEEAEAQKNISKRWWRKERLARIPGLAKGWAYGKSILLNQFAKDLTYEALSAEERLIGRDREIELLESALLKQSGSNVVIVGHPGAGSRTVLLGLVNMIIKGKIFPKLEHKQTLQLAAQAIVAEGKTKGDTEALILKLLNEATRVGNVILVIDDFPELVESLSSLGISATELFTPYLSDNNIHIIALANTVSFRKTLENQTGLMNYFERVNIEEPTAGNLVRILEDSVPSVEAHLQNRIVIPYPALQKIGDGATRYIITGALPKRAIDLMREVVQEALTQDIALITPEFVMAVIERKTKMPLGDISEEEQSKLLKLEETLHRRVIGQDEAITAVANAIRRARSGIQNPSRPIGTFLFLGPTGVGKTETAKALAATYFDDEEKMLRFDMSEYQADDDLAKLIGSFDKNQPGILASRVRTTPYSVILLDEFEKSSPQIRNLFLQILDEGFFTDYVGQKINMRNTIIIATSNAGANLIWDLVKQKLDPAQLKSRITEHIQKERIISPELLNRFDSVVVFHQLDETTQKEIARLLLEKLVQRLKKENNITLNVTDPLVDAIAKGGYNPAMGARPMQRFIQDNLEKVIAEEIIKGTIKPGVVFSLTPDMIQKL